MLTPRRARLSDIGYMAYKLRPADREEVWASAAVTPYMALKEGYFHSHDPMVGADEQDSPVCMGGVGPSGDPQAGCVWMLATTDLEKHQISFLRRSKPWLETWHQQYPVLFNCVDERNQLHIKWLQWLGFTFIRRHPEWGFERRPFLEFVRLHV